MLEIRGITQKFGGVTALDNVSFIIRSNEITGVIGPNGAGKTTLFNIISGIYRQTFGTIIFNGIDISGLPSEKLALHGLVRTFQNIELFGQMTVLENAMVGMHTRSRSGIISCMLKTPGNLKEERQIRESACHWLEYTGIADIADAQAGNLPFGKGRLLEIARALALDPKIILMDEPAAGLNNRETGDLAQLIRKIRDSGITVVLVEHDMELVMDVCESILVLNLGRHLAEGSPREIQENQAVIAAYLGEG